MPTRDFPPTSRKAPRSRAAVHALLEELYARYHQPEYLPSDPLQFAHRYDRPEDREVAALIAAAFASGNIKSILAILEGIFRNLGPSPAQWLRGRKPGELSGRFPGLYHRWVKEQDIEVFLALLGETLRRHGTLGNLWRELDNGEEPSTTPTLARFVETISAMPVEPLRRRRRQQNLATGAVRPLAPIDEVLLTSPRRGSACKRMHLFLRWVVRPADGVDLGLWSSFVSPARLVMPVDVHVLRVARRLRLTKRGDAGARTAEEITASLRRFAPDDPTRYDFSLVRAEILP